MIALLNIVTFLATTGLDFLLKYIAILCAVLLPLFFSALYPHKLNKIFCGVFSLLHLAYVIFFFYLAEMITFTNVFGASVWLIWDAFFMYKISAARFSQEKEKKKNREHSPFKAAFLISLLFLVEFSAFTFQYLRIKSDIF